MLLSYLVPVVSIVPRPSEVVPGSPHRAEPVDNSISGKGIMSRFSSYHPQYLWLVNLIQNAVNAAYEQLETNSLLKQHLQLGAFDSKGGHCTHVTDSIYENLHDTLEQKGYELRKIHTRNFGAIRRPRPPHHDFLILQSKANSDETWIIDANYKQFLGFGSVDSAVIDSVPDIMFLKIDDLSSLLRLINIHEIPERFWYVWEDAYLGSSSILDPGMAESQQRRKRRQAT